MTDSNILTEITAEGVGILTLNRPESMNALSTPMLLAIIDALDAFGIDDSVRATVVTGGEKVFAAGADIRELSETRFITLYQSDFPDGRGGLWARLAQQRKPVLAAVAGYALGGGCELAMACDFILAADNAEFGQPEIKLGTMPGAGGTQRLTRAVGKAKAMEMCLTGRTIDAQEAERCGLVSRVVPLSELRVEAIKTASYIAGRSHPAVMMIKDAVNLAYETSLSEGLRSERRAFQTTFATEDVREGMTAFLEKRKPVFKHR
jgi:enoyl-CoA hydratase